MYVKGLEFQNPANAKRRELEEAIVAKLKSRGIKALGLPK